MGLCGSALALLVLAADGCLPSAPAGYAPAPGFIALVPPSDTPAEVSSLEPGIDGATSSGLSPASARDAAASVPETPATFEAASIVPVLDEPSLRAVRAAVEREAYKEAAELLAARVAASATPTATVAPPAVTPAVRSAGADPAWLHQLGLLYQKAGLPGPAVRAFDDVAITEWTLADDARLHAARLLVEIGEPSAALVRLDAMEPSPRHADATLTIRARALAALSRIDEAAPLWQGFLAREPRPSEWQLEGLRFARALLNQPSEARAELAVSVARVIIHDSPFGKGGGEARELEQQALSTLPSTRRERFLSPPVAELVDAARSLADAQQGREALAAVDRLLGALARDGVEPSPSEAVCAAHFARGKALATLKRYVESSDAYGTALEKCGGDASYVNALFLGARSALRAGHPSLARQRYGAIESRFPDHRFADDARLHGAEAARELGDVAAFTEMLTAIADAYPNGDMVDEGLFTLARDRMSAGDWASAVVPLERAIRLKARRRPYWAEGRPQYFLARAHLELGERDRGMLELAGVIRDYPLGYYMLLAYSRLAELDLELANRTLAATMDGEPRGELLIPDDPELHRPEFRRAVELVRQGESRAALAELELLGVRTAAAPAPLLWAAASLLARIDAPAESHGVLRASGLWDEHYPAGIWRSLWEVAYPRPHRALVATYAKDNRIPEHLAYAIMREESAFLPRASSPAGAYGLMQLILPTAERMAAPLGLHATPASLKTPAGNIPLGCRYLAILAHKFPSAPVLAIPSYNAGPGATARWLDESPGASFDLWVEAIPYTETRDYTKRVLRSMAAYAMLYDAGMAAPLVRLPLAARR